MTMVESHIKMMKECLQALRLSGKILEEDYRDLDAVMDNISKEVKPRPSTPQDHTIMSLVDTLKSYVGTWDTPIKMSIGSQEIQLASEKLHLTDDPESDDDIQLLVLNFVKTGKEERLPELPFTVSDLGEGLLVAMDKDGTGARPLDYHSAHLYRALQAMGGL